MSIDPQLRVKDYLLHIHEALRRIHRYIEDINELTFLGNTLIQDAVIRNIEVVGEACNNIKKHHPAFAEQHHDIPWTVLYAMRNRVSHGYFKVDLELLWATLENNIPVLDHNISQLLSRM